MTDINIAAPGTFLGDLRNALRSILGLSPVVATDFIESGDTYTGECIQRAIDYALENNYATVYLPEGEYEVNDTIHLGYGVGNYNTISLEGACGYAADNTYGNPRAEITSTFV